MPLDERGGCRSTARRGNGRGSSPDSGDSCDRKASTAAAAAPARANAAATLAPRVIAALQRKAPGSRRAPGSASSALLQDLAPHHALAAAAEARVVRVAEDGVLVVRRGHG